MKRIYSYTHTQFYVRNSEYGVTDTGTQWRVVIKSHTASITQAGIEPATDQVGRQPHAMATEIVKTKPTLRA